MPPRRWCRTPFAIAAERWPVDGLPPNPQGWIVTTARNRATDRLRREAQRPAKYAQVALASAPPTDPFDELDTDVEDQVSDDRLRLIFTCCHPALGRPAQVGLTLRCSAG